VGDFQRASGNSKNFWGVFPKENLKMGWEFVERFFYELYHKIKQ
jgi:hypothetical protein